MWLLLLEWSAVILVFWFWVSQIFWPMANGRKWFPMFRKRQVLLEDRLSEEKQRAVEESIVKEIKEQVNKRKETDAKPQ